MNFTLIDERLSDGVNYSVWVALICYIMSNIMQIVYTIRQCTTDGFSSWSLALHFVYGIIFVIYSIAIENGVVLMNTAISLVTAVIICGYMLRNHWRQKK